MFTAKEELIKLVLDQKDFENDKSKTVYEYLNKIQSYKLDALCKETSRLEDEEKYILEQTQDLAVTNYKTFIETANCSKQTFLHFNSIGSKLDELIKDLPKFEKKCLKFSEESSGINNLRTLNSLTLTRNAQLLEILELPQLMHSFIEDGQYEDALELASYVRKLYLKHSDIPIFKGIAEDVEKAWQIMLRQLLSQLKQELTLPKCLQIVGHLRRMDAFSETELRLKFLQARNHFWQTSLSEIRRDDASQHLNKTIEITRVNLFNIVTQYNTIFNDDERSPLSSTKSQQVNQNVIFFSWIRDKIFEFLKTLEEDLERGVTSLDSILGQCMYFGLSFSKVGCDFRSLLIPIFTKRISQNFQNVVHSATDNFNKNIEKFTLINKNHPNVPWKAKLDDPIQPPDSLLEFYPLAEYLNNLLTGFNELRLCAPIAVIKDVIKVLQDSLLVISKAILVLYGQEQQAFTSSSKDAFIRFCMSFADDLVPYIQKCVHILFPPSSIASLLGVNVQLLQDKGISFLDKDAIVSPIKHLLPVKIEPKFEKSEIAKVEEQLIEASQEEGENVNFNENISVS